jgi:hypothetical protein
MQDDNAQNGNVSTGKAPGMPASERVPKTSSAFTTNGSRISCTSKPYKVFNIVVVRVLSTMSILSFIKVIKEVKKRTA